MKYIALHICLVVFFISKGIAQNDSEKKIEVAFNKAISHHYTNKDSAYYYYEKVISLSDKQNNLEYLLSGMLYLINANGHYFDLNNYEQNILREEKFLFRDSRFDTLSNLQFYKDYLLFDKGNYNYKIKQHSTSKKYFLELYSKIDAIPKNRLSIEDIAMMSSLYSFLGLIYHHTGKYELATYNFNKDISLLNKYRDSIDDWESGVNNSKKLLSQVFAAKGEFNKANSLLVEVLKFYKTKVKNPRYKNNILSTYIILTKNYIKEGNFELALLKLNELSQFSFKDNPFEKEIDLLYGDIYLGLHNYKKALVHYDNGLSKSLIFLKQNKHQDIAIVNARLGKLYMNQSQIDKGLQYYQLALMQLEEYFNNDDINSNPDPEKVDSKTRLITILREKLDALFKAYTETNNEEYLHTAHKTSKTIITTLDLLRPEFESKVDRNFLVNETYPSIQTAIEIAFELYENTANRDFINDAFYFMEKSKSITLLEAHRNSEATKYGDVPNDVINEGQRLRAKISHLEKQIFTTETADKKSLNDTLYSLKSTYYKTLNKIEKKYPKYYFLKYNSDVVTMQYIKQKLQSNQALLSYLATENYLYLVVIEKDNEMFIKFSFDTETKERIKKLYRNVSQIDIQDVSIIQDSRFVYKAVLEMALKRTNATDLIIMPDDILYYIPFEALISSDTEDTFLLKKYSISYANSGTLLQEQDKDITKRSNKLLVFAPEFELEESDMNKGQTNMLPLLYNEQEAMNIARYFNGTIYKNDLASISNFKEEISNHNLIHFATHASANDEFPDYSYLAFSKEGSSPNLLYVKDLYNYQINANMVTLSACQTGIGKLQKGEGMLSLARAFNYSGVSAIVNTLWKINDQSTSEIMGYFYENLDKGLSKKEALRKAKLTYLVKNEDDLLHHPYYWSGIVLTGNAQPIVKNNKWSMWIFLIVIISGLLLVISKKSVKLF